MNQTSENAAARSAELQRAFSLFNDMSGGLIAAYGQLEAHVASLTDELQATRAEREAQFAETSRLAQRLSRLLSSLPHAVVVLDGDGIVRECNPKARELLNEPLSETPWRDVIARAFVDTGPETTLANGRMVEVETCSIAGQAGQIVVLNDVTESRLLQREMFRQRRLIEMGELMARLAHQIRTPLSAAMLYASHFAQPSNPDSKTADKLSACLRQLERQVSDMLLFAHAGAQGHEAIAVSALLAELRTVLEPQVAAMGYALQWPDELQDSMIHVNAPAVLGALQNLLLNAAQACGGTGNVTLRVRALDGAVDFLVSDTGPGIAQEHQGRLFEPFFTTRTRGNGLGLAVVHAVAMAHGGSAWLVSSSAQGSTFCLRLPTQMAGDAADSVRSDS